MPTVSEHALRMRRYYQWHAPLFDLTRWAILRGRREFMDNLTIPTGARVLDVGCGTGQHLLLLSRAVGPTGHVHAIDCAPAMLHRAARRAHHLDNVHLELREYTDQPIAPHSFDHILFSYSLSMIPAWRAALDCAERDLKPTGHVAVVDFLEATNPITRRILTNQHVHLGADRHTELLTRFATKTETCHTWLGLWRYYHWIGHPRNAHP